MSYSRLACVSFVVLSLGALPAGAAAAEPPGKSLTAIATANVEIDASSVAKNSKAIGAAVDAARDEATAAAIEAAKEEGARLATAGGLTLGALWSVAELAPTPFGPFGNYGTEGTFGTGKYCGLIRTQIFRRTTSGQRRFTGRVRRHFGCRVPAAVSQTVSVTFAAS